MRIGITHIVIVFLLVLGGCRSQKETSQTQELSPKPTWVDNRPLNSSYYIGIGSASKAVDPLGYAQNAKKNAMDDLTSEISVIVKSESFLSTIQVNKHVQEQFSSNISTSSDLKLENFEVVDVYENEKDYFIYYRLSKAEYARWKAEKKRATLSAANDYRLKAEEARMASNIKMASDLYLRGLFEMKDYWNDVNEFESNGSIVYLDNEIYQRLRSMIGEITLESSVSAIELNPDNSFSSGTEVKVKFNATGLSNADLEWKFLNGKYRKTNKVKTDNQGNVKIDVKGIEGNSNQTSVWVGLTDDFLKVSDLDQTLLKPIIETFTMPEINIGLRVKMPVIGILSEEKNLNVSMGTSQLKQTLFEVLQKDGFELSSNHEDCDYIITLDANTRQGGTSQGFHVAYLDMNINAKDKSGNTVFMDSMSNIKGLQLSFEAAGVEAYKKASKKIEKEIIQAIESQIF